MTDEAPPGRKRDRLKRLTKRYTAVPFAVRTGDLPKRAASAVVMLAVAGGALWAGGWWWTALVSAVGLAVLFEWSRLTFALTPTPSFRGVWFAIGLAYVGFASLTLIQLRLPFDDPIFGPAAPLIQTTMLILCVIAVDVGAYFSGRAIGGPKIAPRISPSKTWAGLFGGVLGVLLVVSLYRYVFFGWWTGLESTEFGLDGALIELLITCTFIAVIAQAGDFFESWMKRKAGVKDSGNLIPGHGGLFDRVDGLLAVALWVGLLSFGSREPTFL